MPALLDELPATNGQPAVLVGGNLVPRNFKGAESVAAQSVQRPARAHRMV